MFISKEDLKKPQARGKSATATGLKAGGAADIVEKAKIEREERELLRRQTKVTLQIQAVYRSHLYRRRFKAKLRCDFDQKIGGIQKVTHLLKVSRDIVFSAPGDVCLILCRLLCFGKFVGPEVSNNP